MTLFRRRWPVLVAFVLLQPFPNAEALPGSTSRALGKTVTLRGGVVMPSLGLGSSGGCHPDPDGTESKCGSYAAVKSALAVGYRSFHDALSYGNQAGLGAAIKDSGLPRGDVFLMSMIPVNLMGYDFSKASVEASLAQLQVSYIDLVMVHHRAGDVASFPMKMVQMEAFPDNWGGPGNPTAGSWLQPPCAVEDATWLGCQDGTWRALTELKAAGKIKAIGVSNWMIPNLQRMKDLGQELPAVNQIEQHIGWHDSQMTDWCAANGVVVQAASPFARAGKGAKETKALVVPGVNAVITRIAAKYNKTPAQVSLRFLIEKGVSPIPSATNSSYQRENLDIFDFQLKQAEVVQLGRIGIICRDFCTTSNSSSYYCHKCWGDPADLMCGNATTGDMFHCP